jgi:hypothetical protein
VIGSEGGKQVNSIETQVKYWALKEAILNGAIVNVNDAQVSVIYACIHCGRSVVKYVPSWWNTAHEVQFIHVGPPCS